MLSGAASCTRLHVLLFLLLDKDLLKLCNRLVPGLRQGGQGKGCSKQGGRICHRFRSGWSGRGMPDEKGIDGKFQMWNY